MLQLGKLNPNCRTNIDTNAKTVKLLYCILHLHEISLTIATEIPRIVDVFIKNFLWSNLAWMHSFSWLISRGFMWMQYFSWFFCEHFHDHQHNIVTRDPYSDEYSEENLKTIKQMNYINMVFVSLAVNHAQCRIQFSRVCWLMSNFLEPKKKNRLHFYLLSLISSRC